MRNKYGKLLIEIVYDLDNDKWNLKEECISPLLAFAKQKQFKEVILYNGSSYFIPLTTFFGGTTCTLNYARITIGDDGLSTGDSYDIAINFVLNEITISAGSY